MKNFSPHLQFILYQLPNCSSENSFKSLKASKNFYKQNKFNPFSYSYGVKLKPPAQASTSSAVQEELRVFSHPKIHYIADNSRLVFPFLTHINPFYAAPFFFFVPFLILSFISRICFPMRVFPSGLATQILAHTALPLHLITFDRL